MAQRDDGRFLSPCLASGQNTNRSFACLKLCYYCFFGRASLWGRDGGRSPPPRARARGTRAIHLRRETFLSVINQNTSSLEARQRPPSAPRVTSSHNHRNKNGGWFFSTVGNIIRASSVGSFSGAIRPRFWIHGCWKHPANLNRWEEREGVVAKINQVARVHLAKLRSSPLFLKRTRSRAALHSRNTRRTTRRCARGPGKLISRVSSSTRQ